MVCFRSFNHEPGERDYSLGPKIFIGMRVLAKGSGPYVGMRERFVFCRKMQQKEKR